MRTLRCVVVDDDLFFIDMLTEYIKNIGQLEFVKSFTDPLEALNYLNKEIIAEVLFIDIEMPGMSGFHLVSKLRHKINCIIFISGHPRYAVDAFEAEGDGYILKPFSFIRFEQAVDKFLKKAFMANLKNNTQDIIFIKCTDGSIVNLSIKDIILVESKHNYVIFHTTTQTIIAKMTLMRIEEVFSTQNCFLRVHRGFVISCEHVKSIFKNQVLMSNGVSITVGDFYKEKFAKYIKAKLITQFV